MQMFLIVLTLEFRKSSIALSMNFLINEYE